ncbi:hypothetical protein COCCADRAFT_110105 [Bipolaris zeicola 26-R-13]|uniref:Uncharacterized protein n=1 Tax=Cochliobolus carbonum (strain 26-R-13) TaxID=930089 RepID=W6XZA7_COCC2|nr:uncharacterized protein COCCADRAFT_110105 [Bipolaris zeicola 26-R-13]EUC28074.1 hypothetical protein COCCADRAFT_110105 [Bipolaris zeicola 26-R-13]
MYTVLHVYTVSLPLSSLGNVLRQSRVLLHNMPCTQLLVILHTNTLGLASPTYSIPSRSTCAF